MGWDSDQKAYLGLRVVLHALRDHLTVEATAHLGAQLPTLLRGVFYEGWKPTGKPIKERHRDQFLAHVTEYFREEPEVVIEDLVRAVFKVLSQSITEGEIKDIQGTLPAEIRNFWS
jgi:uncharacterized protein (DUF2267 family)